MLRHTIGFFLVCLALVSFATPAQSDEVIDWHNKCLKLTHLKTMTMAEAEKWKAKEKVVTSSDVNRYYYISRHTHAVVYDNGIRWSVCLFEYMADREAASEKLGKLLGDTEPCPSLMIGDTCAVRQRVWQAIGLPEYMRRIRLNFYPLGPNAKRFKHIH